MDLGKQVHEGRIPDVFLSTSFDEIEVTVAKGFFIGFKEKLDTLVSPSKFHCNFIFGESTVCSSITKMILEG